MSNNTVFVLYDVKYPYLAIDIADSIEEIADKYSISYHRVYMAVQRHSVCLSSFTVEKVVFDEENP